MHSRRRWGSRGASATGGTSESSAICRSRTAPIVLPMSGDVGSQYTPAAGWAQVFSITVKSWVTVPTTAPLRWCRGRGLGRDQRLLVGAHHGHDTHAAPALLHRRQRLRYLGAGEVPDSGRGHRGQSRLLPKPARSRRRRVGPGRRGPPAQEMRGARQGRAGSRAAPAHRSAAVRPLRTGHPGVQDRGAAWRRSRRGDPLPEALRVSPAGRAGGIGRSRAIEARARADVEAALAAALARPEPDASGREAIRVRRDPARWDARAANARWSARRRGTAPAGTEVARRRKPTRINMLTAIRRTLEHELAINPKMLVFGEDVGPKGGVHAATMGLQDTFGERRVFDTSLSEEGIIGRAVGMALVRAAAGAGNSVPQVCRPRTEQLNNCGTMRWRTHNRFAAPIVVRMPGGYAPKCGDPWHSVCGEVLWAHGPAGRSASLERGRRRRPPSRGAPKQQPDDFFEHRALLDGASARRPYPGDDFVLPLGQARIVLARRQAHSGDVGARWWSAARAGARNPSGAVRGARPPYRGPVGPSRRARLGAKDPALPDRPRGHPHGRVRGRGRRSDSGGGLPESRCTDLPPRDPGRTRRRTTSP